MMMKRLILGVLLTVVALSGLLAVWLLRGGDGSTHAQGDVIEMGIDPEVTGNTASTLGTLEDCVRVDVASPAFDDVSDYNIDVYVLGDTLAPTTYGIQLNWDNTAAVHIANPGTNLDIKLPGAVSAFSDPRPDSDGGFNVGSLYFAGGPGIPGDGAIARIGLDIGGAGIVTFSLAPAPLTAYTSEVGEHLVTLRTAQLAINEDCPQGGEGDRAEEKGAGVGIHTIAPTTPTAEEKADLNRCRWGNISIAGGCYRDMYSPPGSDTSIPMISIQLGLDAEASVVTIDANTGEVVYEDVRPQHVAELNRMLASVRIEGADVPEVWPYSVTPPPTPRQSWGKITFLMPDPASGIVVSFGAGDGPEGGGLFLQIRSDRSHRFIDAETGEIFVDSQGQAHDSVDERDQEAFDRFTSSIEVKTR